MTSVHGLAEQVRRALALIDRARAALTVADAQMAEARDAWAHTSEDTYHPDAGHLPGAAEAAQARVAEVAEVVGQAAGSLRSYLDQLGVTPGEPTSSASPRSAELSRPSGWSRQGGSNP